MHITAWGVIGWNEELDLCPDALYMELTGKTEEELFPALRAEARRPVICRFSGIVMRLYCSEHGTLHFHVHAQHGDDPLVVDMRSLQVMHGALSPSTRSD